MRWVVILLVIMLVAGCSSERDVSAMQKETIVTSEPFDVDNDGRTDVTTYVFAPIKADGITTQRTISAYVENEVEVGSFNEVRGAQIIEIVDQISEFDANYKKTDDACASSIGTLEVNCGNLHTCVEFCSAHSAKCKRLAEEFRSALGHSVLLYVRDMTEVRRNLLPAIGSDAPKLNSLSDIQKRQLIETIERLTAKVASANANPIISQKELMLCGRSDYRAPILQQIAKKVANYSTRPMTYHYRITVLADRTQENGEKSRQLGFNDLVFADTVPTAAQIGEEGVASPDAITTTETASGLRIEWPAEQSLRERSIFFYEIETPIPPEELLDSYRSPQIRLKTINLEFLQPVVSLYLLLFGILQNYYIALGLAFAFTLIVLRLGYVFLRILIHILRKKLAGQPARQGIYAAFMRTTVQWKTDIITGTVALGLGLAAATIFAKAVREPLLLLESVDFLIAEPVGLVAILGVVSGPVLIALSIENIIKVYTLEQFYGKRLRDERGAFVNRANELKADIEALKKLIAVMRQENFEVNIEDDLASSISIAHVTELSKKMDEFSKREVENHLIKIEGALQRLEERKRIAQENWEAWKTDIHKQLEGTGEVYGSALTKIPPALRLWALRRFAQEHAEVSLEGEVLKRREVSVDTVASNMLERGLFTGVVLTKDGKAVFSKVNGKSGTMAGALTTKLLDYMQVAIKEMALEEYNSIAIIGDSLVAIGLRHKTIDALLILKKERFKEAIEEWKAKMKNF